ncbi:hypothetical protein D4740_06505 [Actinomyces sp. 2119]|uniref:Serine/arginine repetitive matrix protein 2 n=2 Tax=Actinomycetaceae TaxID=2049 RepID=A0ABN5PNZ7_9ACTO|nr:hypothetical protein D5R93_08710 [Actinomyces lilanjuaniae]RJF42574.1 hypothetical protein D4740_06505 [Actinomyces sp. 2119]
MLLATTLVLGACGSLGGSDSSTRAGSATSASPRSSEETPAAEESPTRSGAVVTRQPSTSTPTPAATTQAPAAPTQWPNPDVKFYNEDESIWYQDDSVANSESVGDEDNIEGYRTNNHACIGYVARESGEELFSPDGNDNSLSKRQIETKEGALEDYSADDPVVVDLVRDDEATMEGYEATFTATYGSDPVEGHRFARTVSQQGFMFSAMVICDSGAGLTTEQWHTILSGLRLEGIDATPM